MKKYRVGLAAALVLVLAGCSGSLTTGHGTAQSSSAGSGTPTAAGQPTSSTVPTPTPTSTVAPTVITTVGLGDLKIGRSVPTSTKLVKWDPSVCISADTGIKAGDPAAGAWTSSLAADYSQLASGIVVNTKNRTKGGALQELVIYSSKLTTKSGAHVGSTVAELKTIFPKLAKPVQADMSDLYIVKDSVGQVIFEVAPTRLKEAWAGQEPLDTVLWIIVRPATASSAGFAGGAGGGSTCPG